jgi:fermentation-respiration switch protein FrsA (DUF1100 family)
MKGRFVLGCMHLLLVAAYVMAPVAAVLAAWRSHKADPKTSAWYATVFTLLYGVVLGVGLSVVYAKEVGGTVSVGQVGLAAYFAIGMLCILKWFDLGVRRFSRVICRCRRAGAPRWRVEAAALLRLVVLAGIGLPYVMAAVMTYRIKVHVTDTPGTILNWTYSDVHFRSADGVDLAAWWIPAQRSSGPKSANWGTRTILMCHGLAASKANQLDMVRDLVPAGFNVLAFDFRAHGDSGGQLTTFGDLERQDVLAAVRWIQQNHPEQAKSIDGLGISMGAAALIAAAVDDSPEGRSISAVAVYSTYGDLPSLAESVGNHFYFPGAGWLADHLMLPMAGAQSGSDLTSFSPAALVGQLSPRPVMFVHGEQDMLIDFSLGETLYNAAEQPKSKLWIERAGHDDIIENDKAARAVIWFFSRARPII